MKNTMALGLHPTRWTAESVDKLLDSHMRVLQDVTP